VSAEGIFRRNSAVEMLPDLEECHVAIATAAGA
jgi:hypothetical protein